MAEQPQLKWSPNSPTYPYLCFRSQP